MIQLVGYLAALCTTLAFVPQAWKTIQSKDTSGISLSMYAVFSTGVLLWLAYGLAIGNLPIIVANAITLVLALTILFYKFKYS